MKAAGDFEVWAVQRIDMAQDSIPPMFADYGSAARHARELSNRYGDWKAVRVTVLVDYYRGVEDADESSF